MGTGAWGHQAAGMATAAQPQVSKASYVPPSHNPESLRPIGPRSPAERTQAAGAATSLRGLAASLAGMQVLPSSLVTAALLKLEALSQQAGATASAEAQSSSTKLLAQLQDNMHILLHTYSPHELASCARALARQHAAVRHDLINRCLAILADHQGAALKAAGTSACQQLSEALRQSGAAVSKEYLDALSAAAAPAAAGGKAPGKQ